MTLDVLQRCIEVAKIACQYDGYDFDGIAGADDRNVEVMTRDSCDSAYTISFPTSWLDLDPVTVHACAKAAMETAMYEENKRREQRKAEVAREQEASDRRLLASLKAKYEGGAAE